MNKVRIFFLIAIILGAGLLFASGRLALGTMESPDSEDASIETNEVHWLGIVTDSSRESWTSLQEDWSAVFAEEADWINTFDAGSHWYLGSIFAGTIALLLALPGAFTRKHLARASAVFAGLAAVLVVIGLAVFSGGYGEYEEAAASIGMSADAGWSAGITWPILALLSFTAVAVLGWLPTEATPRGPPARTMACPRCKETVDVPGGKRPVRVSCTECGASGMIRN